MQKTFEVTLTPADFAALQRRDLRQTVCVVFDVLRATSSMLAALANGAESIIPVAEIAEAVEVKKKHKELLLAGERHGVRIRADQSGGLDFDFGNSPHDFSREKASGKSIAWTTTNGTRALRACIGAQRVFIASFANLQPMAKWIRTNKPAHLILVCAGTYEESAYEDTLGAGGLADLIWDAYGDGHVNDSAQIARQIYLFSKEDLLGAMQFSWNGRRLLSMPELRDDVPFCLRRDTVGFVAELSGECIRKSVCP